MSVVIAANSRLQNILRNCWIALKHQVRTSWLILHHILDGVFTKSFSDGFLKRNKVITKILCSINSLLISKLTVKNKTFIVRSFVLVFQWAYIYGLITNSGYKFNKSVP